jgi:hypothetical protein
MQNANYRKTREKHAIKQKVIQMMHRINADLAVRSHRHVTDSRRLTSMFEAILLSLLPIYTWANQQI